MTSPSFENPFALVIGVNKYASPQVNDLRGAVADAEEVKRYLEKDLKVPPGNIKTLLDQNATRVDIINGFEWLTNNLSIQRNQPILIFFAGHGGVGRAPEGWRSRDSLIQFIVPHDYHTEKEGELIRGIPDLSIGRLLTKLAIAKGDNIIVIFDCCYSGSGTRQEDRRRARFVDRDDTIPPDIDSDLWTDSTRDINVPKDFKYHGMRSHVLLSACSSGESAMEVDNRGVFTRVLLATLRSFGVQNLTYQLLIERLGPLQNQHPWCDGTNRERYWFKTTGPPRKTRFYKVTKDDGYYILNAGEVDQMFLGCELSLYREQNQEGTCLGKIKAITVDSHSSIVELVEGSSSSLSFPLFAVQTLFDEQNALRIHLDPDTRFKKLKAAMEMEPTLYKLVNRDAAQLEIGIQGDMATFTIVSSSVEKLELMRIPYRVPLNEELILEITDAASTFFGHLNHQPAEMKLKDPVKIHFTKLVRTGMKSWDLPPKDATNLNKDNQVALTSGDSRYGMEILNTSKYPLYLYLLQFNCSNFYTEVYYQPPTANGLDEQIPLAPGKSITIGYGDGGSGPWQHSIPEAGPTNKGGIIRDAANKVVDVFKLIITTQPIKLPFDKLDSPFVFRLRSTLRDALRDKKQSPELWGTVFLPVVVTASSSS